MVNCSFYLQSGASGTEVGSTRVFGVGPARLFEQLVALDDAEHRLQWVLISHPQTISPFNQASFVNYKTNLQLRPVTTSNHTYVEWTGHFYTEPQYMQQMQGVVEQWYLAGFHGMQDCVSRPNAKRSGGRRREASSRSSNSGEGSHQGFHRASFGVQEDPYNPSVMAHAQQPGTDVHEAVMDTYLMSQQGYTGSGSNSNGASHHNAGHAAVPPQPFPSQSPLPPAFHIPKPQQNTFSFHPAISSPLPKQSSRLRHESASARVGELGATSHSSYSSLYTADRQPSSQLSSRTDYSSSGHANSSQLSALSNMSTDDLAMSEGLHAQHELLRQSTLDRGELNRADFFFRQASIGAAQSSGFGFHNQTSNESARTDSHMQHTDSSGGSTCTRPSAENTHPKSTASEKRVEEDMQHSDPCFTPFFQEEDDEHGLAYDLSQDFMTGVNVSLEPAPKAVDGPSDDIEMEAARLQARAASLHKQPPTFAHSQRQASPFAWMNTTAQSPFSKTEGTKPSDSSQQSDSANSSLSQEDGDHFRNSQQHDIRV